MGPFRGSTASSIPDRDGYAHHDCGEVGSQSQVRNRNNGCSVPVADG